MSFSGIPFRGTSSFLKIFLSLLQGKRFNGCSTFFSSLLLAFVCPLLFLPYRFYTVCTGVFDVPRVLVLLWAAILFFSNKKRKLLTTLCVHQTIDPTQHTNTSKLGPSTRYKNAIAKLDEPPSSSLTLRQ